MLKKETAIIIINYKGWKDTIECLESVFKLKSTTGFQVFVVDNSPANDVSSSRIIEWAKGDLKIEESFLHDIIFPNIKKPISYRYYNQEEFEKSCTEENLILIRAKRNEGFAAANNIVIHQIINKKIFFKNVWLLNNDTIVEINALYNLEKDILGLKEPAVRGSLIFDAIPPFAIQSIGFTFEPRKCKAKNIVSKEYVFKNKPIDFVSGSSFFVNREFIEIAGLIPEEYFLYYEELSWIKKSGQKNIVKTVLDSKVYHKGGGSTKIESKPTMFSEYYVIRNKLLFTKINYPEHYFFVSMMVFLIALKRIFIGEFKRGFMFLRILLGFETNPKA